MLSEEQSDIRQNLSGGAKANDSEGMGCGAADSERIETDAQIGQINSGKRRLIIEAIERLKNGTYGECLNSDCNNGNEISEKRLKAVPEASYCIGCQEQEQSEPKSVPKGSFPVDKRFIGGKMKGF